jgi:tol-pal system protein YbgF
VRNLCLSLLFLANACAHGEPLEDRAQMREALERAKKHNDELEQKLADLPAEKASAHGVPTTPQLRVVRIGPDDAEAIAAPSASPSEPKSSKEAAADPEDGSPRPIVRVIGSLAPRPRRRGEREGPGRDAIEVADPEGLPAPIQSNEGRPSALDPNARKAYDDALSLVYAKKFDAALDAFAAFLMRWPDHPNADNAHYWRGECYVGKGDLAHAEEQFAGVLRQFPMGNKIPDALLKLSIVQEKLGKTAEANQHRERLLRDYPKSDAAKRVKAP